MVHWNTRGQPQASPLAFTARKKETGEKNVFETRGGYGPYGRVPIVGSLEKQIGNRHVEVCGSMVYTRNVIGAGLRFMIRTILVECILLYSIILSYPMLCCIVLYRIVLYRIVLYCLVLYGIGSCYDMLLHNIGNVVLYCIASYYATDLRCMTCENMSFMLLYYIYMVQCVYIFYDMVLYGLISCLCFSSNKILLYNPAGAYPEILRLYNGRGEMALKGTFKPGPQQQFGFIENVPWPVQHGRRMPNCWLFEGCGPKSKCRKHVSRLCKLEHEQ